MGDYAEFDTKWCQALGWLRQAGVILTLSLLPIVSFTGAAEAVVVIPSLGFEKEIIFRNLLITPCISSAMAVTKLVDIVNIPIEPYHELASRQVVQVNRGLVERHGEYDIGFGNEKRSDRPLNVLGIVVRVRGQGVSVRPHVQFQNNASDRRWCSAEILDLHRNPGDPRVQSDRLDHQSGRPVRHLDVSALRVTHGPHGSERGFGIIFGSPGRDSRILNTATHQPQLPHEKTDLYGSRDKEKTRRDKKPPRSSREFILVFGAGVVGFGFSAWSGYFFADKRYFLGIILMISGCVFILSGLGIFAFQLLL